MPMWQYSYGYGIGGFLWMALGMLLLLGALALLIWGIIHLATERAPRHAVGGQPHSALEILEQRYARGEIDEQTFQRMREQLGPHSVIPADPVR